VAYLLRQIKYNRWLFDDEAEWISRGKAPADIAPDFAAEKNRMSLWIVDDQKRNINRLILALVGNRSNLQHFEHVLFHESILSERGIPSEYTPGDVLDLEIAYIHIDVDVEDLDGLIRLAKGVWLSPTIEIVRTPVAEIVMMAYTAFNQGTFRQEFCKPSVFAELQKKWKLLAK